jgi:hypothetical protein
MATEALIAKGKSWANWFLRRPWRIRTPFIVDLSGEARFPFDVDDPFLTRGSEVAVIRTGRPKLESPTSKTASPLTWPTALVHGW